MLQTIDLIALEERHRRRLEQFVCLQEVEQKICAHLQQFCIVSEVEETWWEWVFGKSDNEIDLDKERQKLSQVLTDLRMFSHQLQILQFLDLKADLMVLGELVEQLQSLPTALEEYTSISQLYCDMLLFQEDRKSALDNMQQLHDLGHNIVAAHLEGLDMQRPSRVNELYPIMDQFLQLHHAERPLIIDRENRLAEHLKRLDEEASGRHW